MGAHHDHDVLDAPDHHEGHAHAPVQSMHATWRTRWRAYAPAFVSAGLLAAGLYLQYAVAGTPLLWLLACYVPAYLVVGWRTVWGALRDIVRGEFFDEKFLMSLATLGAFAIGEYAEGVAVMLFYEVGELFQHAAVNKAKRSIQALLDLRPTEVTVLQNGQPVTVHPREVEPGDTIRLKPGEQVALDGTLTSDTSFFNTSALTGEAVPKTLHTGETVLAGMINLDRVAELKVTTLYHNSKLSQILKLVQEATQNKAPTQLFISKFAKVYTPVVVALATALVLLPYFFTADYHFSDWLYRGLVFLVVSCPCGLVISIPLGYFGGIGAGSRNGILFKGSGFLDMLTKTDTVVLDKTGTLTKGVFTVQQVFADGLPEQELLQLAGALEGQSTHPVARAVAAFAGSIAGLEVTGLKELAGHGLTGCVNGRKVAAGNLKLLESLQIAYPEKLRHIVHTVVAVAVEEMYVGCIVLGDELKPDSKTAIHELQRMGIRTVMLSGDKAEVAHKVGQELGLTEVHGSLLPDDKVRLVKQLKQDAHILAFAGDGLNDAPAVAFADVGIAMGGLGSDLTIETADVVIQGDQPSRIPLAIKISRATRQIVWQNIALALGIKIMVLALGAFGVASLWEAVFADVGVALLAILNAVRIQYMKFQS